jgi:UDP-N-acetylglucosamine 4-epimerase
VKGADVILHQAALGSVPRSIEDPLASHASNVTGFLNVLWAAREAGIRRVVYASSSSVYGDHPGLPKVEDLVGRQLSPYAVTKYADELYAHAFGQAYGLELLGLRYFNVFGPRQDPNGPYAAVIPLWFRSLLEGKPVYVNGDGETSRDFCYVENVVQANLLAATTENPEAIGKVYNVAVGDRTTLLQLFEGIRAQVAVYRPEAAGARPVHREARAGDVRHSLADVSRARQLLGYEPAVTVTQGLARAAEWYRRAAATS